MRKEAKSTIVNETIANDDGKEKFQKNATSKRRQKPSTLSRTRHCCALTDLEEELLGDAPPNISLPKRNQTVETGKQDQEKQVDFGEWNTYKTHYIATVLSGLSDGYRSKMLPVLSVFERFCNPQRVQDVTPSKAREWVANLREQGLAGATIKSYWRHLTAFLSLAADDGIMAIPRVRMPRVTTKMKGRPITGEEFDRLKLALKKTKRPEESWTWDLNGLWFSGLRISEAYRITWEPSDFYIDMDEEVYVILGDQKNGKHQQLPIVPEFLDMLRKIPENRRNGTVFGFRGRTSTERISLSQSKGAIAELGSKAGIKTGKKKRNVEEKTATAHDLRRSFGSRWAMRVEAVVLQKLMRHEDIQTTMTFYAHFDVRDIKVAIQMTDQIGTTGKKETN